MTLSTVFRPHANLALRPLDEDRAADLYQRFWSLGLLDEADSLLEAFEL